MNSADQKDFGSGLATAAELMLDPLRSRAPEKINPDAAAWIASVGGWRAAARGYRVLVVTMSRTNGIAAATTATSPTATPAATSAG